MSRRGERNRAKERFWRTMLRQWRRSGLSVRDFCAERELSEPNFYTWRRTIAERDRQARRRRQGDRHGTRAVGQPVFVPVHVVEPTAPPALEVVLGGGHLVRVPADFDAATLRQLLAILQETPPC